MPAASALAGTPTPILFFTGKGGVGKTSLACATAIQLADAGERVLLVSTDPASNLDEVLNVRLAGEPGFTHVLLVTLPEATPVHEAAHLQADLRRASIEPWAWVVNQSFAATPTTDPVLRERSTREHHFIDEVRTTLASRVCVLPWQPEPPVGPRALLALAGIGAPAGAR